MKTGSIVGLAQTLTDKDIELLKKKGLPVIDSKSFYIVSEGPRHQQWNGPKRIVAAIKLVEVGGEWLDSSYFAELQPPQTVDIENLISQSETCLV